MFALLLRLRSPAVRQRRHVEIIELNNDGKGLGFGIVGGRSTGVMVKTILPGGAAGQVGPSGPSIEWIE